MRLLLLLLLLLLPACAKKPAEPQVLVDGDTLTPFTAAPGKPLDVRFDGLLRLLSCELPAEAAVGAAAEGSCFFLVERDLVGRSPMVFVHARVEGAEQNQAKADHALHHREHLVPGDVVVDRFRFVVPAGLDADLVVRVGVFEDKLRWKTEPPQPDDSVVIGALKVTGAAAAADVVVHKRAAPIVVDGVLDEPDWRSAQPLDLRPHHGRGRHSQATTAKLVYDDEFFYVSFAAADDDVFSPYTKRDDPLYESEAYEIFIDADGDRDEYVELQSNAFDVHFDAAFKGGRRQNMDTSYDVPFTTKTVVNGGVVTQEWAIPIKALRDASEPKPGASWHINLFRLERRREGEKIVAHEASAWSPPLGNDFHNLARFGVIRFGS